MQTTKLNASRAPLGLCNYSGVSLPPCPFGARLSFISNLELGEKRKNLHKIINFINPHQKQLPELEAPPSKKRFGRLVHLIGTAVNFEGIPAAKVYPAVQSGVDSAKSCLFGFRMFQQVDAKKVTHSTCPRENQGTLSSLFCLITLSIFVEKRWRKAVIPVIPQSSLEGRARRPQDPSLDVGQTGSQHLQGCKAGKAARAE